MQYPKDVVIVAGARTAHGKFKGSLFNTSAVDLGALAIKETLKQVELDAELVDEVINFIAKDKKRAICTPINKE